MWEFDVDTVLDVTLLGKLSYGRRDGFASDARFTHLKRPDKASVHTRDAFCRRTIRNSVSQWSEVKRRSSVVLSILYSCSHQAEVLTKRFAYVRENDNRHMLGSMLSHFSTDQLLWTWAFWTFPTPTVWTETLLCQSELPSLHTNMCRAMQSYLCVRFCRINLETFEANSISFTESNFGTVL